MLKKVYPPLYAPGIHDRDLAALRKECVDRFANNGFRNHLVDRLAAFLGSFDATWGLTREIWVNGSFLSEKEIPSDIDLVLLLQPAEMNALAPQDQMRFRRFMDRAIIRARYDLDVMVADGTDQNGRMYWRGCFGFAYDDSPKGFIRLI